MLSDALQRDHGSCRQQDMKSVQHLAQKIEVEVDALFPREIAEKAYREKIRSLHYNIKHNEKLRHKVLSLLISPRQLAFMSPEDLEPSEQRQSDGLHHLQDVVLEIGYDIDEIIPRPSPEDRRNEEQLY